MTKLEIFNELMSRAKDGGYTGEDYASKIGFIIEGTNIYSLIFREDFAKAIWGDKEYSYGKSHNLHGSVDKMPTWEFVLVKCLHSKDRWAFLEDVITINE
jgi:hypothetical protein